MTVERTRQWGAVALAATLVACGGGGDGGTTPGAAPPAPTLTISGVAATGAAFTGAVITVIDSRGQTVGTSQPVGDTGSYSITLSAGAVAPFVLVAKRTDANGASDTLVSVVPSASTTTANITPITTLIASRLSPNGDPTQLDDALAAGSVTITPQAVADTVSEVQAILAPLLSATGTDAVNPLTGSFSTNGTGYDRLLDSLAITFIPASATSTNIEVSVKQATADASQPTSVSFSSDASTPPALPNTIDATKLPAEGLSVKIANFLQALTACYAVPFEQRVNGATSGVNAVTGTAADVIAPACQNVFSGNDPANFRNNGGVVGRDANNNGAFSSLFRRAATGASFGQGAYEFTRGDGSIVISYKNRAPDGAESYDTFVIKDDGDGVLRLIGNQYQYGGRVAAYHQRRNFITLDQSAYDYYSTGYSIDIPNDQVNGSPRFNRVLVTTPTGAVLTFKPSGNSSFLGLVKTDNSITGTSFVRLRSEYVAPPLNAPHPSTIDGTLFFVPTDRTEADLAAAKAGGTWKFEYFLNADDPATLADDTVVPVVQYYKNRARALTIGELRTQGLAPLSPTLVAEIAAGANPANQPRPGQLTFGANEMALIGTAGGGAGWSVATGQLPPTSITLFGTLSGVRFTDSLTVGSTARSATVPCSRQSGSDTHCHSNGDGTYGPGFADGATLNGLHLFARDPAGREYANFYAMYQLALP